MSDEESVPGLERVSFFFLALGAFAPARGRLSVCSVGVYAGAELLVRSSEIAFGISAISLPSSK